uniref:Integrase catalytic domain-containing protein n=2 Tax=Photinus pyralis TaxID=7054 RepID=A0A1Y1N7Y6_PHOPY
MGNLPKNRVTPSRAFLNTGVDYAGPIWLKTTKGRGHKANKGYISVFVCLATRAIHLEVVSDYTSDAFIAAYKRFTARRGICATLRSDCGTTLVGADAELRKLFDSARQESRHIEHLLAQDGTQWIFNPPAAPHFGGIWEAGVKSTKHHLKRTIGESTLTFEEMSTLLAQVEACLNSRPLQALTDDPDDLSVLTPGHFLIGGPPATIPEPSLADISVNRLSRWQLIRQQYEHFWQRWSHEYLHEFQTRSKWQTREPQVKIGDLAVLKNELQPPSKWVLARIIDVHPGQDGVVRVVTVRTATSTFKRPIVKLCLLPRTDEKDDIA